MKAKRIFERLLETTSTWRAILRRYDDEQLWHHPSAGEWSLAELFDHLIRVAEHYQLVHFNCCLEEGQRHWLGKKPSGYVIFDLDYLPDTKIRMESFPADLVEKFTPVNMSKSDLLLRYDQFMAQLDAHKEPLFSAADHLKHPHPFFGWINAKEWFSLIEIHFRHHEPQRKRIEGVIRNRTEAIC